MRELVEYGSSNGFGKRLQTIDQEGIRLRPVYDQSIAESMRPVTIHINVNRDAPSGKDKPAFNIFKSKFAWLLVSLAITFGVGYARSRYMCQGLKDGGKFYYGMDVNRCVSILIKEPFATVEQQLAAVNGRY